eukprot:GFKZ01004818.1.p1 GENE.GFKZ01004818.1~~GFKZ01004818.1.p1  ORF type:complete len:925 (+),score=111.58 GFKZ01004818.1:429-3203(+)
MPPKTRKRGGRNPNSQPRKTQPESNHSRRGKPPTNVNKASQTATNSPAKTAADDNAALICTICAEVAQDWAVGHCGHVVCGDCSHRMRVLYDRKTCVMCNAQLNQVVVVPIRDYRPGMNFDAAVALPGAFQDKQVAMWFVDRARCQQLKNVRGWKCSHKQCNKKGGQEAIFANLTQLRAHVRSVHRAIYCEICLKGKKCFVSEMQLYPLDPDRNYSSRLRSHLKKDHPQCKFCREYFLDTDALFAHLQEAHETCSICERNGRMHEYYRNYEELENHYRREHYVCPHEGCRGVVFATQIELQTHEHTNHGGSSRGNRPRALRVNLQQLHGDRDTHRNDIDSPRAVRREQERQAARRQAFLSSNVVFAGAVDVDDGSARPSTRAETRQGGNPQAVSGQANGSSSGSTTTNTPSNAATEVRRPDDGHFHPLDLPRDAEEVQARNKVLVRTMRSLLDPAAYEQFRMSSGDFHSGKITAEEYYNAVTDSFGVRAAVRDILPELVALLPTPLLREPLLRICLQRTDTKLGAINSYGESSSGAGSSSQGGGREEQFPSLNGNSAPVRNPQPIRRFGAPGPEEFPRLNRVNKPRGESPAASSSREVPRRPSASADTSQQRRPNTASSSRAPPQRTAASVLKETRESQQAGQRQRTTAAAQRSGSRTDGPPTSTAFPALASALRSGATPPLFPPLSQSTGGSAAVGNGNSEAPNSDVSLRAGAVWGGAGNRGRKRGPGRGRRPASPPPSISQQTPAFPELRPRSNGNEASASSENRRADEERKQPKVIDVLEIAKSRKNATQKSSLPKVGGSGYGFAWERKKAQQKKKQIKNDMEKANASNMVVRPGSSVRVDLRSQERTTANLDSTTTDTNGIAHDRNSVRVIENSNEWVPQGNEEPDVTGNDGTTDFDPYSYLKEDRNQDDPVTSFLGGSA